jgi:hypothetical protein
LSRLAAAMLRESSERALRVANQLADHSARRLALLERIAAGLEAGRVLTPDWTGRDSWLRSSVPPARRSGPRPRRG